MKLTRSALPGGAKKLQPGRAWRRAAFAATLKDPAFVAEMERTRRELTPESGEVMQQLLEDVAATPAATLAKLIAFTRRSDAGAR